MTDAEKIKLLKKQKTPPICERCGQPVYDCHYHYIKTRTRGELWYHEECFFAEVLDNVDAGKKA